MLVAAKLHGCDCAWDSTTNALHLLSVMRFCPATETRFAGTPAAGDQEHMGGAASPAEASAAAVR
jgi:hypothetical protein